MRFQPHDYQREAISRMLEHPHYGLFLDMGLGKTIITLSALQDLMYDRFSVRRALIIAPRSVAESTWQDEAAKWDHLCLRFSTVIGTARQRADALARDADCYVINRENVVWLCEYYRYRLPFDALVIDESSSFKNNQAKRFKALRRVRGEFSHIYILTGTPAPNTLMDLWSQVYLVDGGKALGHTISAYRQRFFRPDKFNGPIVYSYKLQGPEAEREIYDRLEPVCMSLKAKDYLSLPDRIDNVVRVNLPDDARATYKQLEKDLILSFEEDEVTAASAAALSNKLLQMANGRVYTDDHVIVRIHRAKLDALRDIIEANSGMPVLVFYNFQHDRDALQQEFPQSRMLRDAIDIRDWNAGKIPLMLAHPASSGYGLNLQAGGHIIVWYGLTWSLELYQQANARLYRQGQDKPVIIHHLVASGTMDEQVMAALASKAAGQDALLEAVKAKIRAYKESG